MQENNASIRITLCICGFRRENMEERLLKLKNLGCDIDGAMNRFLGDKEFYF